jgi:hypothetical protein
MSILTLELKQAAETPENEAKERHQKLWEGSLFIIFIPNFAFTFI